MDPHYLDVPGPDIVIRRTLFTPEREREDPYELVQVNVPRTVVWHSPTGFDVGTRSAGAADLALNILQHFLPGEQVTLLNGAKCSPGASHLHLLFRDAFLVHMDKDGGVLPEKTIREWIEYSRKAFPACFIVPSLSASTDQPLAAPALPDDPVEQLAHFKEDYRRLIVLCGDFLFLQGYRLQPGAEIPRRDPAKTYNCLRKLDEQLRKGEVEFGIPAPKVRASA